VGVAAALADTVVAVDANSDALSTPEPVGVSIAVLLMVLVPIVDAEMLLLRGGFVGVTDPERSTEMDGVSAEELDAEAILESNAVDDSNRLVVAVMVIVLEPVIDADAPNDIELVAVSVPDGVTNPLHDGDDVREEDALATEDMGVCDSEFSLESVGVSVVVEIADFVTETSADCV
jgi:hypothetical protein